MRLVEGWWMYQLPDLTTEDGVEACVVVERMQKQAADRAASTPKADCSQS